MNCQSQNCIISCENCLLQYVGKKSQTWRGRFNMHRSINDNKNKVGFCKRWCDRFHLGVCKNSSYTVQIIEELNGNGRTSNNKMDLSIAATRRKKRNYLMFKLRTVYPHDLRG